MNITHNNLQGASFVLHSGAATAKLLLAGGRASFTAKEKGELREKIQRGLLRSCREEQFSKKFSRLIADKLNFPNVFKDLEAAPYVVCPLNLRERTGEPFTGLFAFTRAGDVSPLCRSMEEATVWAANALKGDQS